MRNTMKLALGLIVLSGLGLVYGAFNKIIDEKSEGYSYVFISFSYPGDAVSSVMVKKTPKSKCNKWQSEYFSAANQQCVGCTVLANECRESIPDKYIMAFNKESIGSAYVFKPYSYPEITVYEGALPEGAFAQLCAVEKENMSDALCFE